MIPVTKLVLIVLYFQYFHIFHVVFGKDFFFFLQRKVEKKISNTGHIKSGRHSHLYHFIPCFTDIIKLYSACS